MKNQTFIEIILVILASLGLVALGMSIQRQFQRQSVVMSEMKPDTTYIHDTTYIPEPVPVLMYVDRTETELISESPIIIHEDSLEIPIETKVYENEKYKAVVEGYHPKLKDLEIYSEQIRIRQPVVIHSSKWSIGVTGGLVVTEDRVKPGVVIGATYSLKQFPKRER